MSNRKDRAVAKEEKSKLSCKVVDCSKDKHCYQSPSRPSDRQRLLDAAGLTTSPAGKNPYPAGRCWACGDESIPWALTQQRNQVNIPEVVQLLTREKIRSDYWTRPFDEVTLAKARKEGQEATRERVGKRLRSAIGKPASSYDGRQTPWTGDILFYAQHATATCCRKCFECWHGIPRSEALSEEALRYAELLVLRFLSDRAKEIWLNEGE